MSKAKMYEGDDSVIGHLNGKKTRVHAILCTKYEEELTIVHVYEENGNDFLAIGCEECRTLTTKIHGKFSYKLVRITE